MIISWTQFRYLGLAVATLSGCWTHGQGPTISIVQERGAVIISYTGILQTAEEIAGPWADVEGASSPFRQAPGSAKKFYQAKGESVIRAVETGQGVEIMQVSYGSRFPATDWGRVVVDHNLLARKTGITGGFVNVFTRKGWAVRNLPLPLAHQPPSTRYFDLGLSASGRSIEIIELKVLHSEVPLGNPAKIIGSINYARHGVAEWLWNVRGIGPEIELVPGQPPPTYSIEDVVIPGKETFAVYQPVTNEETAYNQCWPMAVANCLQFLENEGHIKVVHNHTLGLKGDNTLVGALDTACDRKATSRCGGQGVCIEQMLDGKFKYLSENQLNTGLSHRHQGRGALCQILSAGNYSSHGITSQDDGASPTWEWVADRMDEGWAVEAVIIWAGGGGHAVRVTGYGKTTGTPWIRYSHDSQQCHDSSGLENVVVEVNDSDKDGWLNVNNTGDEIVLFVATGW